MAKIDYHFPVDALHGRLVKKDPRSTVQRRKLFRDENGRIVGRGCDESYLVTHPRDYKKNPLQGAQLANVTAFGRAVALAKAEREDPVRLAYWRERWHQQLVKGEEDAPINPKTKKHHVYRRLDIFIQSVLQREIRLGRIKI